MTTPAAAPALRCVIIDDNHLSRLTLEHLIEMNTSLTLTASLPDGLEALNFFGAGGQADVLFLDVEMPGLSGPELLRALPQPHPQVVFVTAHPTPTEQGAALPMSAYLTKPVAYARFAHAAARLQGASGLPIS